MNVNKYNRSITLLCPTCGGTEFSSSSEEDPLVKCTGCGLELTRDELISRNQENISMHAEEVKREVAGDLKKKLVDAFRGSKHIKIK